MHWYSPILRARGRGGSELNNMAVDFSQCPKAKILKRVPDDDTTRALNIPDSNTRDHQEISTWWSMLETGKYHRTIKKLYRLAAEKTLERIQGGG